MAGRFGTRIQAEPGGAGGTRSLWKYVILLLIAAALAWGIREVSRVTQERISAWRDATTSNLLHSFGYRLTYRDMALRLLSAIEFHDLAVYDQESAADPVILIRRLRLHYSFMQLVMTRNPLAALREIEIGDTDLAVDLVQEQGPTSLTRLVGVLGGALRGGGDAGPAAGLPPIDVAGENLGLVITINDARIELQELDFRVRGGGEPLRITASSNVRARLPPASVVPLGSDLAAAVRIDATAATDFSSVDATVQVSETTGTVLTARPLTLRVTMSDGRLEVTKVEDRVPLELKFMHDLTVGHSELRFVADRLEVTEVAHFHDQLLPRALAGAELTGSGTWTRHPERGISYSGSLAARIDAGDGMPAVAVELAGSGDLTRMVVARLEARGPNFRAQFSGDLHLDRLLAPRGVLTVQAPPLLPGTEPWQFRFVVGPNERGVELAGEQLQLGDVSVRRFAANVWPASADQLGFHYRARGEIEQDAANSIRAEGMVDLSGSLDLTFSAEVTGVEAGALYRLATGPEYREPWLVSSLDPLLVSADVAGRTNLASVSVERTIVRLIDEHDGATRGRVRLDRDRGEWFVEGVATQWNDLRVHADARVTPAGRGFDAVVDLTVNDHFYEVVVAHRPGVELTARGSQFELTADYATDGVTTFHGSVTSLPIAVTPPLSPMHVSMTFDGTVTDATAWSLTSRDVRLDGVAFLERGVQVDFGFRASPSGASVEPITLRANDMELTGSGNVTYGAIGDPVTAELTLFDGGERERYVASLEIDQGELSVDAELRGVPLERIGEFPISGRLRARLNASGPPHELAWSATVATEDARLNDEAITLGADVTLTSGNVTVAGFAFEMLSHRVRDGALTYDRDSGRVRFGADFETVFLEDPVAAHLTLSVDDLHVSEDSGLRQALAKGVEATLRAGELQVAGEPVDPWQVTLFAASTADPRPAVASGADSELVVRFAGGPNEAFDGFVSTAGRFQIRVRGEPFPLRATAAGNVTDGQIDADVSLEEVDARLIGAALGSAPVSLETGTASGSVRVAGALSDPGFWGTIRLTGATLVSDLVPQVLGPFTAEFGLDEKRVSISRFISASDVMLPLAVGGEVTLERFVPTAYRLELAAIGPNGVEVDHRFGPVRFAGSMTGEISVTGDGNSVAVRGQVRAVRGDISLGDLSEEMLPVGPVAVDLVVTTGRSVEFTWPRPEFPVLRATLAPEEQVRIRYDGGARRFSVDGDIGARSGDLFYFDRQFRLREGRIRLAENESRFDPRLQVRAEIRERDPSGDPVRIILSADTSLSELSPETVRLSSDPPRSAIALDALVRDPFTAQNERIAGGAGSVAAAFSGDLLMQTALLRPLERALRQALGVDMVGIRMPLVQNLVYDGLAPQSDLTIGNPFDDTSVSVGKHLADDLFFAMLFRLDTSADSTSRAPPLLSDVEFNLEWISPFFILESSFLPRDASTLFLTDVTLTLSWRWRY